MGGCSSSNSALGAGSPQQRSDGKGKLTPEVINSGRSFSSAYCLGEELGEGASAKVFAARLDGGEEDVWGFAAKIVELQDEFPPYSRPFLESVQNEAELWRLASRSVHVVQLVEAFHEPTRFLLVSKRCDLELISHMWNLPEVNESSCAGVFYQMLQGLAFVHSLGMAHRDVKPDNFLVASGVVKLSDFGLARFLGDGPGTPGRELQGVAGTAPFMSPEMVRGEGYGTGADLWSLGAMAYVLLLGRFPYEPKAATPPLMKQAISEGFSPPNFKPCLNSSPLSDTARSFVQALLQRDPNLRPDARKALSSSYVTSTLITPFDQPATSPGSVRPALRRAMRIGACSRQPLPQPKASSPMSGGDASTFSGGSSPFEGRSRANSADSSASQRSIASTSTKAEPWQRQYSTRADSTHGRAV